MDNKDKVVSIIEEKLNVPVANVWYEKSDYFNGWVVQTINERGLIEEHCVGRNLKTVKSNLDRVQGINLEKLDEITSF